MYNVFDIDFLTWLCFAGVICVSAWPKTLCASIGYSIRKSNTYACQSQIKHICAYADIVATITALKTGCIANHSAKTYSY